MEELPPDKVRAWKEQYGHIASLTFRGKQYVFRCLTRAELDVTSKHSDWSSADEEDYLAKEAVLWPEDFDPDKVPAGLVTNIADEVKEISGAGSVYTLIDIVNDSRDKAAGFIGMVKSFILAGIPRYTVEELDDKTIYELMDLLAIAEKVLELQGIAYGADVREPLRLHIKTPEELAAEAQQKLDEGNARKSDPIAQKLYQAAMMEGMEMP